MCIREIVGIAVLSKPLSPGTYAVPVLRSLALLGPLSLVLPGTSTNVSVVP